MRYPHQHDHKGCLAAICVTCLGAALLIACWWVWGCAGGTTTEPAAKPVIVTKYGAAPVVDDIGAPFSVPDATAAALVGYASAIAEVPASASVSLNGCTVVVQTPPHGPAYAGEYVWAGDTIYLAPGHEAAATAEVRHRICLFLHFEKGTPWACCALADQGGSVGC